MHMDGLVYERTTVMNRTSNSERTNERNKSQNIRFAQPKRTKLINHNLMIKVSVTNGTTTGSTRIFSVRYDTTTVILVYVDALTDDEITQAGYILQRVLVPLSHFFAISYIQCCDVYTLYGSPRLTRMPCTTSVRKFLSSCSYMYTYQIRIRA